MLVRRQATLFVSSQDRTAVETVRARFNPIQFGLIRAHVTLCREDEARDWDRLALRLRSLPAIEVAMSFGPPVREGNLVYLPAISGRESFAALRHALLSEGGAPPREHKAHITLIHPRNSTCSDAQLAELQTLCGPFSTVFREVSFIEQVDGGAWHELPAR